MSAGDVVDRRIGAHGLEVVTIASTTRVTPQVTLVAGVLGTAEGAELLARTGDIETYKRVEPRRSARQDRKG